MHPLNQIRQTRHTTFHFVEPIVLKQQLQWTPFAKVELAVEALLRIYHDSLVRDQELRTDQPLTALLFVVKASLVQSSRDSKPDDEDSMNQYCLNDGVVVACCVSEVAQVAECLKLRSRCQGLAFHCPRNQHQWFRKVWKHSCGMMLVLWKKVGGNTVS
jgi:hypothetical protein